MTVIEHAVEVILDPKIEEYGFTKHPEDAGFDLRAVIDEPVTIKPHSPPVLIPTGVRVHINNPNIVGLLFPRSSLGVKHGLMLANTVGVIDSGYQGEIKVALMTLNNNSAGTVISPYQRIAQIVFTALPSIKILPVKEFSRKSLRGEGGFGSTGDI